MTEGEADKSLAQGFGTTSLDDVLRVREALLVKDGMPETERELILRDIAAAFGRRTES